MSFNPELNQEAQEVILCRKTLKSSHPKIYFNNWLVFRVNFQKHLGVYLDMNLNLNYHIEEKMTKKMNRTGVIKN